MTFEINDRIYNDIELYCKSNNLNVNEYITDIITEKHSYIKYGDLNNILGDMTVQSTVESKKRVKKAKKTAEEVVGVTDDTISKEHNVQENEVFKNNEQEDIVEQPNIDEETEYKVQRKKRSLKTL